MKKFLFLLIIIWLILAINSAKHESIRKQNSITGIDVTQITEPIQITHDNRKREKVTINGLDMEIEKLYSYEIVGRVVATYEYKEYYTGNTTYNTIASKDVGIAWGKLAKDEFLETFEFENRGGRALWVSTNNNNPFLGKLGGWDNIWLFVSNNHLITTDKTILSLINEIEEGDFIQLKGYLVNVYGDNGFRLPSSVNRTDHGNHGCEVILVEDVKWIR